jgi:outer membrane receptor for ferrienterochelin and colicin
MKSSVQQLLLFLILIIQSVNFFAQTTISGTVTDDSTQQWLTDVNVIVVGTSQGTVTDSNGKYALVVNQTLPFIIRFSYLGFRTEDIVIDDTISTYDVVMIKEYLLGQEVVISASRLEQSILESPVSIELMDIQNIQQASSADYYDAIGYLKGVQVTSTSMNLVSVNTRGFADVTNPRFVQIVDGMDTADPTINANLGSILVPGELDIESIELLPGAASALYGSNAFNGLMIMNSKNPFEYEGLSLMTKAGITKSEAGGSNPVGIYSLRYAKVFNDKFAFKVNLYYMGGEDWVANDYKTDRNNPYSTTDLSNSPDFDGLNLHGDETPIPINDFGIGTIRRTGIKEEILLDHNHAQTLKADIALHYKIKEDIELVGAYFFAEGNSIGQEYTKFAYRDFTSEFYRLELNADNFFVRSYITFTNVDDTYDVGALGALVNERFNPSISADGMTGWVPDYITAFLGGIPGVVPNDPSAARTYADRFMIDPITGEYVPSFQSVVDEVRTADYQSNPEGASLYSKSNIWNSEIYYNFIQLEWAEIIAGGNFKQFSLFSNSTIFDDSPDIPNNPERIFTNNYGVYTQISKIIADKFKATGSIRYDKMKDFDGHFSPRISLVYSPNKNNNARVSYQTGFRYPDMLSQFVYFPTPGGISVGGVPSIASRYGIYNGGAWTVNSYDNFFDNGGRLDETTGEIITNPGNITLETANVSYLKPEELSSIEIGYNIIIGGKLLIDFSYYNSTYKNFIGSIPVYSKTSTTHQGQQINAGTLWSLSTNSPSTIKSDGYGLGLTYNLPHNFVITGNYTHTTFSGEQPEGFLVQFNTPENRYNLGFGNSRLFEKLGFSINYSYQDGFTWESLYGIGPIASYSLIDAQVNYTIPSIMAIIKIGGTNIGGSDYRTSYGSSFIGQTYFVSIIFDELLK